MQPLTISATVSRVAYPRPEKANCKRCKRNELAGVLREYRMSNALLGDRSRLPDEQARTCREHIGDSRRDCTTHGLTGQ